MSLFSLCSVVTALLAICFVSVGAQDPEVTAALKECSDKLNVSPGVIIMALTESASDDHDKKCVLRCLVEELGMMSPDGTTNTERIHRFAEARMFAANLKVCQLTKTAIDLCAQKSDNRDLRITVEGNMEKKKLDNYDPEGEMDEPEDRTYLPRKSDLHSKTPGRSSTKTRVRRQSGVPMQQSPGNLQTINPNYPNPNNQNPLLNSPFVRALSTVREFISSDLNNQNGPYGPNGAYYQNGPIPYNQNGQPPYNPNGPYNQNGQQPFNPNSQQPFNQNGQQPFNSNSQQPFNPNSQQPFNPNSQQPFNQNGQQPLNQNGQQPFNPNGQLSNNQNGQLPNAQQPFNQNSQQPNNQNGQQPNNQNDQQPNTQDTPTSPFRRRQNKRTKRSPQEVVLTSTEIVIPPEAVAQLSERLRKLFLALIASGVYSAEDQPNSNSTLSAGIPEDTEIIEPTNRTPRKRRDEASSANQDLPLEALVKLLRERANSGALHQIVKYLREASGQFTDSIADAPTTTTEPPRK